jgi:hypothetical protein
MPPDKVRAWQSFSLFAGVSPGGPLYPVARCPYVPQAFRGLVKSGRFFPTSSLAASPFHSVFRAIISRVTSPARLLPRADNNNINKKNTENKRLGCILPRLGVVFRAFISYFRVQKNTGFLSHV